ncbi:imm11 family protein [Psychromonas algicola]|uniref:imm11 family protein n=1 Tax=Psychromonas algicola TaxID=2555642 RepID=UPI0010673576|nr:DUF1629 domain-containing protein [Psychromonas sp. RZ5]TEW52739.1 hypothetical protein E2R67_01610 [Psychromonas sp. RZ5]
MKKTDYYIFLADSSDGPIIKDDLEEGPQDWEFLENESLLDEFPEVGVLHFSNENEYSKLYDFIENRLGTQIVSTKVKEIMLDHGLDSSQVEYFPVTIKDQNSDVASNDYFMLNYINAQPIIDMTKSEYELSSFDDSQISVISKTELDLTDVDPKAKIFHPLTYKNITVIESSLLNAFQEAGVTGFWMIPAQGWNGMILPHDKAYMKELML